MDRNKEFYIKYSFEQYFIDFMGQASSLEISSDSFFEYNLMLPSLTSLEVKSVLLIGAGFGRELEFLLKSSPFRNVTVLDFSSSFLKSIDSIYSGNRVRTILHDLNTGILPIEDGCFDMVICFNTLEYLNDNVHTSILIEFGRVLEKGGLLYTRLLNSGFLFSAIDDYHLRNRPKDVAITNPRAFVDFDLALTNNFSRWEYFGKGLKINLKIFRFLYSNYLYSVVRLIEKAIITIFGFKIAKSIYAVCTK